MKRITSSLLFFHLVLSSATVCWADQKSSSTHPNKNQTQLPDFDSQPGDETFVLPRLEDESQLVQPLGLTVTLQQIVFNGLTVFDETILQNLAEDYLHKAIDVGELEALRFKITELYIDQGYVNSGAIIPQQNLKDGILTIDIIEGRLTQITVEGQGWLHPDYIAARLLSDDPFNVNDLQERYLLLLNDPLIKSLNANYKALPQMGESALDLKVTRQRPYQVAVHYNNYNPPSIGAEQVQVDAWVRNLTRWGDKLDFRFDTSEGAESFAGGFAIPLNGHGTLFDFHFNVGRSSVIEQPLDQIGIKSEIRNFNWTLSHPILRDTQQNLTLGASFASRRSETFINGEPFVFENGNINGPTKVSVIRLFQEYMARFENHVLALRSSFNIGINAFHSTIQKGHTLPDSEFFSWLGQAQYAYKLNDEGAQIRIRSNLQLSDEALLSQERIAIGGIYSVRGYRENELVRDNGYSGSIELHYPIFSMSEPFATNFTLVPFMDYGLGWNHEQQTDEIHSIGIGLNWQILKHIKAEIYYAHDLITAVDKADHNLQDDGVHFNLSFYAF